MSAADRVTVLLFLALFFGAVGFLFTLLCCGTEYWLLATESCHQPDPDRGGRDGSSQGLARVRVFHEGLFWSCAYSSVSPHLSVWDLWMISPPPLKFCQAAFLFPFSLGEAGVYEPPSAVVYRTFWSIFLVCALSAVVIGWFSTICASSLTNRTLYKVAGVLQIFGGVSLLAVLIMYLIWTEVLDILEQFVLGQQASHCPTFHLSIQHGPSFLLAPVSVFFCLLDGLILLLVAGLIRPAESHHQKPSPELTVMETDL
ncbi:transmembrane protein 182-like [Synchiropus picturatus]